jgi:acetyltransferase-like isoleucine patch superfamily enzyme
MTQSREPLQNPQYDVSHLLSAGEDVFISANVEIRRPQLVSVGNHIAIDTGFYLTTGAEIGDYVHIGPYITVIGGEKSKLVVEDFATIASGCRIICGSDSFMGDGFTSVTVPEKYRDSVKYTTVMIKKFVGIGTNAVIMPGITLGEGSVVGACSLVTKDTEPWTIYYGNPARAIKIRPKEKMLRFAKELGY